MVKLIGAAAILSMLLSSVLSEAALTSVPTQIGSRIAIHAARTTPRNLATASKVPFIVAQVSLINQTGPISQTTMFTPTKSGLFRISSYLASTIPGEDNYYGLTIVFTDDVALEYSPLLCGNGGYFANPCGGPSTFRAVAGTSVSFYVQGSGPPPESDYNLFIVVEQLM
jgi:hypothetical protein